MSEPVKLPPFLAKLTEQGIHRYPFYEEDHRFDLFLFNLSPWKLRLSEITPFIHVKLDRTRYWDENELKDALDDIVLSHGWGQRDCFILLETDGRRLKERLRGQYHPCFVVVDVNDQEKILNARSYLGSFLDLITKQIPISSLSPYHTGGPVEGTSFFGRAKIIEKIMRNQNNNYAIVGVRRIGKTSLLREIKNRMAAQEDPKGKVIWLSGNTIIGPGDFIKQIVRELKVKDFEDIQKSEHYLFRFPDFIKRMHKVYEGRITIFLDEADCLPSWDLEDGQLLPTLQSVASEGLCRFLFTGYGDLLNELNNQQSPMYASLTPIFLEPFKRSEIAKEILKPMYSLRIKIEDEAEVARKIYEDTQGYPLLVQTYCQEAVNIVEERANRVLSSSVITQIQETDIIKRMLVDIFLQNIDKRDQLIIFALLSYFPEDKKEFTLEDAYFAMKEYGSTLTVGEIDQSCDRLKMAGVFTYKLGKYMYTFSIFPHIFRSNYNPKFLFTVTSEELRL
jgi:hypothetical protein